MKKFNLQNYTKGWLVGDFEPNLFGSKDIEVALKRYEQGTKELAHEHRLATEYTIVINGVFRMNDQIIGKNDIIQVEPNEMVEFECLHSGETLVIKSPSVMGDKYLASEITAPKKVLKIVVPMAGLGMRFQEAGYSFPKPLIEVSGKPMIELVIKNLKPTCPHKFVFICQKEHYEKYSLNEIFNNLVGRENYDCVQLTATTQGAACTVLTAIDYINGDDDIIIANSDQLIDIKIDDYINYSRQSGADGTIMTFESSHPKWSYARLDASQSVSEVAEKKVISNQATVGIYYFKEGRDFIQAAGKMMAKDIRVNNEFYVCPTYNELIIDGKTIKIWNIKPEQMHGLGTPEDLNKYLSLSSENKV
jgi:dTDP-glucose pyrophosphorylase